MLALPHDDPLDREQITLHSERLGPLPLFNHFMEQLGVDQLLERFVPAHDRRMHLEPSRALGVLLRSIALEREPIYRQYETVRAFAPGAFGLAREDVPHITDDVLGRALDRLFVADRGSLLTSLVLLARERFEISLKEFHNDSTTIRFTGQYAQARGRSIRGKRAPWITLGHSKDHRPDLKQLLLILTTSSDGDVPVEFRLEDGNTSDSTTHLATWESLVAVAGRRDFLYVADSKLCSSEVMETIDSRGGRFVTVLPRARQEDKQFRAWIQTNDPPWELVRNLRNPRRKYAPRDRWYVYRQPVPSREAWPITWLLSTCLREHQQRSRQDRIEQAKEELGRLADSLGRKGARKRSVPQVAQRAQRILERLRVTRYVRTLAYEDEVHSYRQKTRGRPGPETSYRRVVKKRPALAWELDQEAIAYDAKSDGMYPLLSNDRTLSAKQVFEAHKRQPRLERKFQNLKDVHEIAPVFLKNEGRIEALFFLHFIALFTQAILEREIRRAMAERRIEALGIYPEERPSTRPTAEMILRLFSYMERHVIFHKGEPIKTVAPQLSRIQEQVLDLLRVNRTIYCS